MADTFTFELVSPERLLVSSEARQAVIPGSDGEMTVMPDHAPVMTTINPGVVRVTDGSGTEERYVIFGGFADILPASCTVLAESAIHVDDANSEQVEGWINEAHERMEKMDSEEEKADMATYLHQLSTIKNTVIPA
ncbi:F0F1 ATP synthase subunit epsilon [Pararhizobium mangrovi]|uniref:ATP synthase epsilon chain n=1 Tax=Pararhizobium mangrovi TaxID=2590452 RepID=A0A506TYE3_9HYPH|nr:F0F1 ATP synthase subunit epsilon [Pararhizobium mangrovi]TPW26520.1 F0F1 ATP synthase subunit epsilon [Pararhizobium mangrovi]